MSSRAPLQLSAAWRRGLVALAGVGLGVGLLPVAALASPAAATQASHFIQVATSANTSGVETKINNGATNGEPGALLFITPNADPGGICCSADDAAPVGVVYNTGSDQWAIFHEDGSPMPVGMAFNVLVVPSPSSTAFVQAADGSNSSGDSSVINSVATNGHPGAVLEATQRFNGANEPHPIGVFYTGSSWAIFNEDEAAIDTSGQAEFNVLVGSVRTGGGKNLVQKVTSANLMTNGTYVNSATTNGDPNAFVIETPNFNPGGKGGKFDPSVTGVYFNVSRMMVLNKDRTYMVKKQAFNLLMYNS